MSDKKLSIYEIIPLVREEVGVIRKAQEATGGARYKYRGTDTIINALAPVLNKYGVFTTVEDFDYNHTSTVTASNKVLTTATLLKKVTFYGPQGDSVYSICAGENSDYSDKATGGASTYAYRYALVQTFVLPTDEDDPDAKYVEKEAPAAVSVSAEPSSLDAVRTRIREKSMKVNGEINGAAYLQVLLDSATGDLAGRKLTGDVWNDESALKALEALLEAAK